MNKCEPESKEFKDIISFNKKFGLYLHIPFCQGKCRYCDFYSIKYSKKAVKDYLICLKKELQFYSKYLSKKKLRTIYFGGGTAGLLEVAEIKAVLEFVFEQFSYPVKKEITVEINPDSFSENKAKGYLKAGVNRVSIGVQSFNDRELQLLGRRHNSQDAIQTIELVSNYYNNFNIDLIFAIPGQLAKDWENSIKRAISFQPTHISLYNLEINQGTEIGRMIARGDIQKVSEEMDAKFYLQARDILLREGYEHYEISNFASPGRRSIHNSLYWKYLPYLGLGPAAHSFNGHLRFSNSPDLKKYLKKISSGDLPLLEIKKLSEKERMAEYIFMGLRLMEGITLLDFKREFAMDIIEIYQDVIDDLFRLGLLKINDGRIKLTEKGLLLANEVFMRFLPA